MVEIDKAFLVGHGKWYGVTSPPSRLPHEVDASPEWNGWRRQRLQPRLVGFLFPAAWSAFLLAAGIIPMLLHAFGHGIGMDLRLGMSLWLGAFALLWFGSLRVAIQQIEGSPAKMLRWNLVRIESILLAVLSWVVHTNPVGFLPIIAMLISIPLWFSHLVRIATVLAWPAGRWLLPIAHVDIGLSSMDFDWVAESKRWARRPLARRTISAGDIADVSFEVILFGLREGNQDFIAVHLVHPSGIILDPFVGPSVNHGVPFQRLGPIFADVPNVATLRDRIGSPPVSPVVAEWPQVMLSGLEEE